MARFRDFDSDGTEVYDKVDGDLHVRTMAWSDINVFSELQNKNKAHISKWEITYQINPGMTSIDFGVWLGENAIGKITLWNIDKIQNVCKVSYWIDADHSGKGYMTTALDFVVSYAFSNLNMFEIVVPVQPGNDPSIRVLEKLKFTRLGQSVFETLDGRLVTHYIYVRNVNANL
jgi:RimJ/RimL family protein N-acetyltransferase